MGLGFKNIVDLLSVEDMLKIILEYDFFYNVGSKGLRNWGKLKELVLEFNYYYYLRELEWIGLLRDEELEVR